MKIKTKKRIGVLIILVIFCFVTLSPNYVVEAKEKSQSSFVSEDGEKKNSSVSNSSKVAELCDSYNSDNGTSNDVANTVTDSGNSGQEESQPEPTGSEPTIGTPSPAPTSEDKAAWELKTDATSSDEIRKFVLSPISDGQDEIQSMVQKKASLYLYKTDETKAVLAGEPQIIGTTALSWDVDINKLLKNYGTYYAEVIVTDDSNESFKQSIAKTSFEVEPTYKSIKTRTTTALDANGSFEVYIDGLKNTYGIESVSFSIYSKTKRIYTCKGIAKDKEKSFYHSVIYLKSLGYRLEEFTVKAVITDEKGSSRLISQTLTVDKRVVKGNLHVSNQDDKSIRFSVTNAIIPGRIKGVTFRVCTKADGGRKSQYYKGVYSSASKSYSTTMKVSDFRYKKTGTYYVYAYGYTKWGTKVYLNKSSFTIHRGTAKAYGKSPSSMNGTFDIALNDIKSESGVSYMVVKVWQSSSKDAHYYRAQKQKDGTYRVKVYAKNHEYHFGLYHIRAYMKMGNGVSTLAAATTYRFEPKNYMYSKPTKVKYAKKVYIYNPSASGKVTYEVYSKLHGKDDVARYKTSSYGKYHYGYIDLKKIKNAGTIYVRALVNGKIIKTYSYYMRSSDLIKQGWYYEKYNGKTYKLYYDKGKKVTDLTDILNLKESSSYHYNDFYVEINRAACCVTIYMKNSETGNYDIPIKTCTVSVGRDTWSTHGTSNLNEDTSYTPLGTYTISGNGNGVKYTLKPMIEPDDSVCYARWATHIVGNVYFHAVAVGAESHYALSPTQYNRLGSPASAGCVRMTVADAKWIYDYVSKGTRVNIVQGNSRYPGPLGKNATIKVSSSIHYDPTDPEVPLSRKQSDYRARRISGYMKSDGTKVGY